MDGLELYVRTTELDVSTLAETAGADHVVGRLTYRISTLVDGTLPLLVGWDTPIFRDSEYGVCNLAETSDGEVRCVPAFESTTFFGDPECTQPLSAGNVVALSVTDSALGKPSFIQRVQKVSDLPKAEVREIGALHEGPVYTVSLASGECTLLEELSVDAPDFYSLGPEVAPDNFVRFELVTDEP